MFVFFFNYTPPTDIYAYAIPLSLPAALPISLVVPPHQRRAGQAKGLQRLARTIAGRNEVGNGRAGRDAGANSIGRVRRRGRGGRRSEEHTSELQSLMRISYAVFCLKKKNNKIFTHTPTYYQTNKTKRP